MLFKKKKAENARWISKLGCFGGNYKQIVALTEKLSLDNEAIALITFAAAPKLQLVFCPLLCHMIYNVLMIPLLMITYYI